MENKKKRFKKVFNSDQVLHLWANQSQSEARNPSGNVFFEGRSCYSYGQHYELGRLVEHNGRTVALINGEGYSNTTAKHIHKAARAAKHLLCLVVKSGNLDDVGAALIERQDQLVTDIFGHFSKLRPWQSFERNDQYGIGERLNTFNQLCDQLGFEKLKLEPCEEFRQLFNCHNLLAEERRKALSSPEAEAKREKARLRKAELETEKAAQSIDDWRNGGPLTAAVRALRLNILRLKGESVETSGGAQVPLTHALRLLALIERGQAKQGERVGHFSLDRVNSETITIGCHEIALSEARAVLAGAKPKLSIVSEKGAANERI